MNEKLSWLIIFIFVASLIKISIGTDDDLPPPHQNSFARNARVAGNGRSAVPASSYPRMQNNDMESQIHLIEQEAYCSVLRAFKAQSDALTWVLSVADF